MRAFLALALFLAVSTAAAQQTILVPEPQEAPSCGFPPPVLFAKAPEGVAFENLAFDGQGNLFVTALDEGLWRAYQDGTLERVVKDARGLPDPDGDGPDSPDAFMGVDVGIAGDLFVSQGVSIFNPVPARVLRFPVAGEPAFEVYAEGLDGANGLAVTPDGVVYVAHGFRPPIWRIPAPGDVHVWTTAVTPNGLVEHPDGASLVYAQVTDGASTVRTMRLDDPEVRATLITLNAAGSVEDPLQIHADRPLLTKGIDDLVVDATGIVYATAHLRLQLVRGDPATGDVCIAMDTPPGSGPTGGETSSARMATGFGAWDGKVFVTDFTGSIWVVDPTVSLLQPATTAIGPAPGASGALVAVGLVAAALVGGLLRLRAR